jgi:2'-5' RNA ligase
VTRRTFLALDLPEDLRGALVEVQNRLRGLSLPIRWVDVETMHISLQFLGESREEKIEAISNGLGPAIENQSAGTCVLKEVGAFPRLSKPRNLHVRVDESSGRLAGLVRSIRTFTESLGFPGEERAFRPHVTLGRIRDRRSGTELSDSVLRWEDCVFGTFVPQEVVFYESFLEPDGVRYVPLAHFPLSGSVDKTS